MLIREIRCNLRRELFKYGKSLGKLLPILRMDRRFVYVPVSLFAVLLFFFSVGYNGWGCGGSIFSRRCTLQCICSERVGALLLTAGALILLATIFLALFILRDEDWCIVVSAIHLFDFSFSFA